MCRRDRKGAGVGDISLPTTEQWDVHKRGSCQPHLRVFVKSVTLVLQKHQRARGPSKDACTNTSVSECAPLGAFLQVKKHMLCPSEPMRKPQYLKLGMTSLLEQFPLVSPPHQPSIGGKSSKSPSLPRQAGSPTGSHIHPDLAQATSRKTGHVFKRKVTEGINVCLFFSPIYNKQPFLSQSQSCKLTVYTSARETAALDGYADLVV